MLASQPLSLLWHLCRSALPISYFITLLVFACSQLGFHSYNAPIDSVPGAASSFRHPSPASTRSRPGHFPMGYIRRWLPTGQLHRWKYLRSNVVSLHGLLLSEQSLGEVSYTLRRSECISKLQPLSVRSYVTCLERIVMLDSLLTRVR